MAEEKIDVELYCGKKLADKINKMTKADLIGCIVADTLRSKVQDEAITEYERKNKELKIRLHKAESNAAQAREMIEAVMHQW